MATGLPYVGPVKIEPRRENEALPSFTNAIPPGLSPRPKIRGRPSRQMQARCDQTRLTASLAGQTEFRELRAVVSVVVGNENPLSSNNRALHFGEHINRSATLSEYKLSRNQQLSSSAKLPVHRRIRQYVRRSLEFDRPQPI